MGVTADRLAQAMEARGLDQSTLAREIGVTQGTISKILLGRTTNSRQLPRIAAHLGVSSAWLLGVEETSEEQWSDADLSAEESELIRGYRQLPRKDQEAVLHVVDRMLHPRTLHNPIMGYRAAGEEREG